METIVLATQYATARQERRPRRDSALESSALESSALEGSADGPQPIAAVMPAVLARYDLLPQDDLLAQDDLLEVRPAVDLPPLAAEPCLTP